MHFYNFEYFVDESILFKIDLHPIFLKIAILNNNGNLL